MGELEIRPATEDDVPEIVAMLADDPLGARRESPDDLTPTSQRWSASAGTPTSTWWSPSARTVSSARSS